MTIGRFRRDDDVEPSVWEYFVATLVGSCLVAIMAVCWFGLAWLGFMLWEAMGR